MFSISSILNQEHDQVHVQTSMSPKRPAVLDISNLLNMDIEKPVLSPSLTPSPASATSSYASYFEGQQEDGWDHLLSKEPRGSISIVKQDCASPAPSFSTVEEDEDEDSMQAAPVKAKRRRANPKQLEVLNRVFERTFFPSTQMRAQLGRELGMSPRTVQIWFQNRRQAMRTRERQRLLRIRDESASD